MIYILFACFFLFFCVSLYKNSKVRRHDGVLFRFCELRRDVIRFLHKNTFESTNSLTQEEYASARRLLDALDDAIHRYDQHKTLLFNVRKLAKYLKQHRAALKRATLPKLPGNREIQALHGHFGLCLAQAFLAYTPLIRWEIVLKLSALAYRRQQQYVIDGARQVRNAALSDHASGTATA